MIWLIKSWHFFLGCLYGLLALGLLLLFVPGLLALCVLLITVGVFSPTFYKHVMTWGFNKALTTVASLLGRAAASFRDAENAIL